MSHIFISHATADDASVDRIVDRLEQETEHEFWVDHRNLKPPESNWRGAIQAALKKSDAGLLVLSKNSVGRPEIVSEWTYILDTSGTLYIAQIDDVPLKEIDYRLHIVQWIDFLPDWEAGITALAASMRGEKLPPTAPVILLRRVSGRIDPRLTSIPMSGRDGDLANIIELLRTQPVAILGVGGLGKSRLAAEIALKDDQVTGAIWHVASETSSTDEVLELLRDHFDLPATTDPRDVFRRLREIPTLVVLDNVESVEKGERRQAYVELITDLINHRARVLITGRAEWDWDDLPFVPTFQPVRELPLEAARQVVLDMAGYFGAPDLSRHTEELAAAARQHAKLIEIGVRLTKKFSPEKVISDLNELKSPKIEDALDEMIFKTVRQMVEAEGAESEAALKRLNVFRGGFTYEAAEAILSLQDKDALDRVLLILQAWQFVTQRIAGGTTRYEIDPLVIAAVGEDNNAHRPHYEYYKTLARQNDEQNNYLGLDVESGNLEAAFEWSIRVDSEASLWLFNACGNFLTNRGRFVQHLHWIERVVQVLEGQADDELDANAQNSLGIAYTVYPLGDRRTNLQRALNALQRALLYRTPAAAPLGYAETQSNLCKAYLQLASVENPVNNLRRAVECGQEALKYYVPQVDPRVYAGIADNLGNACSDLAAFEDTQVNSHQAIRAHLIASRYFKPEITPLEYAGAQDNLGKAYHRLSDVEDRVQNLRLALQARTEALRFYTSQNAPQDYAVTQYNLGNTYRDLADVENRTDNLRWAVEAYRKGAQSADPAVDPLLYADIQNNLGNTYRDLAFLENQSHNQQQALTAFQEALKYQTPQNVPHGYAITVGNLGLLYLQFGNLSEALACWYEAEKYFRLTDHTKEADEVRRWIAAVEQQMNPGGA